jgi:hypothetical protein
MQLHFLSRIISRICVSLCLISLILSSIVGVYSQQSTPVNPIGLEIAKIQKGDQIKDTQLISPGKWRTDEVLNLDDTIRYRWKNVILDEKYRDKPGIGGGFLRVFKDDETKPENLVADHGTSPFPLNKTTGKLKDGENTLIFLFVDSANAVVPASKVTISFNFVNQSSKPQLKITQPENGILLAPGITKEFNLELENIALDVSDSPGIPKGKLSLYYNEVKSENFVAAFTRSTPIDEQKSILKFNSTDIDLSKVPDGLNTNLIFVLTKPNNDSLGVEQKIEVKTNFQNTIKTGLPSVTILEPKADRSDLSVTGEQKFLLQIDNFELLKTRTSGENDGKKGYLQILVDDAPYKTIWGEKNFSLNEIGYFSPEEGRRTIKVQLVNMDFTKLDNQPTDSREIIYKPTKNVISQEESKEIQSSSNSWRTIIIFLTIILIVGGIAILITKG